MAHLVVLGDFVCDLLDREILVLRDLAVAHVLAHDPLLLAGNYFFQEIDRHTFYVKDK